MFLAAKCVFTGLGWLELIKFLSKQGVFHVQKNYISSVIGVFFYGNCLFCGRHFAGEGICELGGDQDGQDWARFV
jgi:hypothetical protein